MGALPPPVSDISIAANGITPPSFWLTVGLHLRKAARRAQKNRARQSRRARPVFQKPRSLSPPQRRKKVRSFSSATCAAKKILLRLQVWNLCAAGAQIMRAADCKPPCQKGILFDNRAPRAADTARGACYQRNAGSLPIRRKDEVGGAGSRRATGGEAP